MTRLLVAIVAVATCAGGAGAQPFAELSGTWVGAIALRAPAGESIPLSIELGGRRAVVALGRGHPARTEVAARVTGKRVRFSLPGRPARLTFDGRRRLRRLSGTVRQGAVRGSFSLRRGRPLEAAALGLYRFEDGRPLGIVEAFGPRLGVLYDDSEIRGLYRSGRGRYGVGAGLQTRTPSVGIATFSANQATWRDVPAVRVPLRQEEVWVRSGRALLACTLSIPPGQGRRPGIVFAHGSGPAPRSWNLIQATYFNHIGIVTLSCDKRGVAQSGGRYPGEFPSEAAVSQYAADVESQARFLAAQPEVDPAKVGTSGFSQAGWIMPRAAARERAVRFMVGLVSPTLTQGETDLWADLNDQGRSPPTRTDEDMEGEVRRAGPSGVDPMPAIRAMRIPAVWLFGAKDRTVPSRLCVERLDPVTREAGRDFTYVNFSGGTHGLIKTENGLLAEADRSNRFVDGLYPTIGDWLRARGFSQIS
jgi:dienelactone hydrolase